MLLLVFACSNSKPVDSSKLAERGGLVYYNRADTPFSGKGIKYWPTGEIKIIPGTTTKAGNSIQNQPHLLSIVIPHSVLECLP